jgi:hypothetical protein
MKLTHFQYEVLKNWQRYHRAGYGLGQWVRSRWKQWLIFSAFGAWSYYFLVVVAPAIGWLYFGLVFGVFFRDISHYRDSRRIWPLTNQVTDWNRVQELVETYESELAEKNR